MQVQFSAGPFPQLGFRVGLPTEQTPPQRLLCLLNSPSLVVQHRTWQLEADHSVTYKCCAKVCQTSAWSAQSHGPKSTPISAGTCSEVSPISHLCFLIRYGWVLSSQPQSLSGCQSLLCSLTVAKCASWGTAQVACAVNCDAIAVVDDVFACLEY